MERIVSRFVLLFCGFAVTSCHSRLSYPKGGYPYPNDLAGKDTQLYRYAIRNIESRQDSMYDALGYANWKSIGEPNLSLRPMPDDVFRFTYSEALDPTMYIIRVTPTQMTVRVGTPTDYPWKLPDSNLLTPLDRKLIRILEKNYPIDDTAKHPYRRRYLDSMGQLYPQLYSPAYYISTYNKQYPLAKPAFDYTTRVIDLNPGEFDHFVSLINQCGYWNMPYELPHEEVMDGCGYSLEANTSNQYNFVGTGGVCADTGGFAKACQALIDYAGLGAKLHIARKKPLGTDTTKPFIAEDVQFEDVKSPHEPHKKNHPKKPHRD